MIQTFILVRRPFIYLSSPESSIYVFTSTYCMKWAFIEIELPLPHSAEGAGLFRLRVCSHFFQALVGIILRGICTANIYFVSRCSELQQHRAKLKTIQTSCNIFHNWPIQNPNTQPYRRVSR